MLAVQDHEVENENSASEGSHKLPKNLAKKDVSFTKVQATIKTLDPIDAKDDFYSTPIFPSYDKNERESLLRAIFADLGNNFFTYLLAIVFCALAIFKVAQVQETRNVIANLNEISIQNENLNKQWLSLLAKRQNLSEHSKIRKDAYEKLNMRPPKTAAEHVIYLN